MLLDRRHWWRDPSVLDRILARFLPDIHLARIRRIGELALWFYEFDARFRGFHSFGAPADQLGNAELACIFSIFDSEQPSLSDDADPGFCGRIMEMIDDEDGDPVRVQDASLLPSIFGETCWVWPACSKTGLAAKAPLCFDLFASDRAIRGWLEKNRHALELPVSVNSIMVTVRKLRLRYHIPSRKAAPKGHRRVWPTWDWIEWKDQLDDKAGLTLTRAQLNRISDAKKLWCEFTDSGGDQWIYDADAISSHRPLFHSSVNLKACKT